ncbi:MAG: DUF423 domain-containing protein [Bdellovibrionota bacterium]
MLCCDREFLAVFGCCDGRNGRAYCKAALPDRYTVYETAVFYHTVHGMGLVLIGLLCQQGWVQWQRFFLGGFLLGVVLFSGSLYAYTVTGSKIFVHITPVGGLTLMLSWLLLAIHILRQDQWT